MWINVLDSVPSIDMLEWPTFLDGLFNMLSDQSPDTTSCGFSIGWFFKGN